MHSPILEAKNFKYTDLGTISCDVLHEEYGWIPFHATPYDDVEYGKELFFNLKSLAESGKIIVEPYSAPSEEELSEEIRYHRNRLLLSSDWTQTSDVPEKLKSAWKEYRQSLRDITKQPGFPCDVAWPKEPDL
jgi:hypothetical protein